MLDRSRSARTAYGFGLLQPLPYRFPAGDHNQHAAAHHRQGGDARQLPPADPPAPARPPPGTTSSSARHRIAPARDPAAAAAANIAPAAGIQATQRIVDRGSAGPRHGDAHDDFQIRRELVFVSERPQRRDGVQADRPTAVLSASANRACAVRNRAANSLAARKSPGSAKKPRS